MLVKMKEIKKMEGIKIQVLKAPLRMHLQKYTGGGGQGGDPGGGDPGGGNPGNDPGAGGQGGAGDPGNDPGGNQNNSITFNTQAELDAHIANAVATEIAAARVTWATETQQQVTNAQTEAEKLANMTDEQKREYALQQREEAIAKREAEATKTGLKATALEWLADKELPKEHLITLVTLTDAESCNKSLEAIEKAFNQAVKQEVDKRLAGSTDIPGVDGAGGSGKDEKGSVGKRLAENAAAKNVEKSSYFKN